MAALILSTSLGCAACKQTPDTAESQSSDLYSVDADKRVRAAGAIKSQSPAAVDLLDPLNDANAACIPGAESTEERCRNYDLFLSTAVATLNQLAIAERGKLQAQAPARNVLWKLMASADVDLFDLSYIPGSRTDGAALRRTAALGLAAAMRLPEKPTLQYARSQAIADATFKGNINWYLLQSCAGEGMQQGCNYASYLFSQTGDLLSGRNIQHDEEENVGAGVRIMLHVLQDNNDDGRLGLLQAIGGFGGDLQRIIVYRLGVRQEPLCAYKASVKDDFGAEPDKWLRVENGRCEILIKEDIEPLNLSATQAPQEETTMPAIPPPTPVPRP